jgi:hypothetical protein
MQHIQIHSPPQQFLPQFTLRSRREQPVRDVFNARQYEHWNTDAPGPVQNFPDLAKQNPLYDMNPLSSRLNSRDYRQAQPFVVDNTTLGKNPYFQKFDIATDPRNVARELQSAVYEYNPPRDMDVSNRMMERNFNSLHVPDTVVKKTYEESIDIYAKMRPKMNDMKAVFR